MIPSGNPTPDEQEQLADCYRSCLRLAAEHGLETVAFCAISTGEFRFPTELAARIAVRTVRDVLARQLTHQELAQPPKQLQTQTQTSAESTANHRPANTIRKVIFDVFSDRDCQLYERVFADHD